MKKKFVAIGISLTLLAGSVAAFSGFAGTQSLSVSGPNVQDEDEKEAPLDPSAPTELVGPIVKNHPLASSFNGNLAKISHSKLVRPAEKPEVAAPPRKSTVSNATTNAAVQTIAPSAPNATLSFNGLDYATWGAGHPADPNGDVGPNNYIESVNTALAIFDKSGNRQAAFTFNDFFKAAGVTNACATQNYGDPYVLYDRYSGRWFISDFAFASPSTGPYYQCIAVSKTADPVAGGWWTYAFLVSNTQLNDYPKFAAWQDGIYMTANLFTNGSSFYGAQATVFNRSNLINGSVLTSVSFVLPYSSTYGYPYSLLAANDVSTTATGPEFLYSDNGGLKQWTFTTNWATPSSSSLSTPVAASNVPLYASASGSAPQLNSGKGLDQLGDRLMTAAQWTKASGTPSVWLARSVAASTGKTGVLWMELKGLASGVSVAQSGVFAPNDGLYRFMPSLAVNSSGIMAVGYSTSSSTTYPGLAYAARTPNATAGTLDLGEGTLWSGTGSQTSYSRWGDYYSMSVDPSDGCSFWMTGSYMSTTSADWQTRIVKFVPATCGAPANATLTVSAVGSGTVTSAPAGISCPSACSMQVTSPTSVTLTAQPASGSTFAGWSGGCTGTGTCTVNLSFSVGVTATFKTSTTIAYTGATVASRNSTISLSALLKANQVGLPNATVTFTLNGKVYSAKTNGSGVATISVRSPNARGTFPISLSYSGDASTNGATATASLVVQ